MSFDSVHEVRQWQECAGDTAGAGEVQSVRSVLQASNKDPPCDRLLPPLCLRSSSSQGSLFAQHVPLTSMDVTVDQGSRGVDVMGEGG